MKPQELSLDCEIFDDFREKMNIAITAVIKNLVNKKLTAGTVTAKIDIEMYEKVTEDGEVYLTPVIEPKVNLKVGAKGKLECRKQGDFLMKEDQDGKYLVATNQISMDEMLKERKGA